MSGVFGKMLEIDVTKKQVNEININPEYITDYIGGASLAARIFLDIAAPGIDSLSSENPLFIMSGPMVGTNFPGTSRFVMCAKSPQTNIWGESSSGGSFGAVLKKSGIDGLLIRGKAAKPITLFIENGKVSFNDAGELWGADTFETIDRLKEKFSGESKVSVLSIGPAGENLVKYAAVCNDKAHYLGRTGMGTVMGSKNLKAIAIRGTHQVPLKNEVEYKAVRKKTLETIKESMITISFHALGTAAAMEMGMMTGDVPIKNWKVGLNDDMSNEIGGSIMAETIVKKRKACFACPIACKPHVVVEDEKYGIKPGPGPEYETCATFGSMLMNLNIKAISKANDLCNRMGLDSISCGATISFIMEAYERGLLNREDTDGLDLRWGKIDAAIQLIEKIAYREGFGDRAAEGSLSLANSLPEEAKEFLVEVKGLELPMHDPRAFHGMGLAYMMSTRGACHLQHSCQAVEQGLVAWDNVGLEEDYVGIKSEGKAKMVFISENIGQMANTLCICHFAHWAVGMDNLVDGFNAVTGLNYDLTQIMEAGNRAWVLKRSICNLMGVTHADDRLPIRVLTPLDGGGSEGTVPDEKLMTDEYYQLRGLNERGIPRPEILESLNLGFLKDRLYL